MYSHMFQAEGFDEVDRRIARMLIEDGRVPNRTIGQHIDMSDATVAARLKRLIGKKCIAVGPLFDWSAAGFQCGAYIFLKCHRRAPKSIAAKIASEPHVYNVIFTSGGADLIVFALAPNEASLHQVFSSILSEPGVVDVRVDRLVDVHQFSQHFSRLPYTPVDPRTFPDPVVRLDDLDLSVISLLQQDGRQSSREIARQLSCSDAKVRGRIKRMEDSGLLRIGAIVDPFRTRTSGAGAFLGITSAGDPIRVVKAFCAQSAFTFCATCIGDHNILAVVGYRDEDQMNEALIDGLWAAKGVASIDSYRLMGFEKVTTDVIRAV